MKPVYRCSRFSMTTMDAGFCEKTKQANERYNEYKCQGCKGLEKDGTKETTTAMGEKRKSGVCKACEKEKDIVAKGLCAKCYHVQWEQDRLIEQMAKKDKAKQAVQLLDEPVEPPVEKEYTPNASLTALRDALLYKIHELEEKIKAIDIVEQLLKEEKD